MLKPSILFAVLVAVGMAPALARGQAAQPWLDDKRRPTSIGIRAGDLELHPGVAGEVGYDSNYLQGAGVNLARGVDEPLVPAVRLRVTPSLSVNSSRASVRAAGAPPPRFDVSARAAGRLDQLWALNNTFAGGSSSKTLVEGDLSGVLNILPQRPWGAGISAVVSRVSQPSDDPTIPGVVLGRNLFGGTAELRWRPGGGSLDWSLGYDVRYTTYSRESLALDSLQQAVQMKGRWLFLPRTSLLYQGEAKFISYTQPQTAHPDMSPVTGLLGVSGLLTAKLGLTLLGGWKATFVEPRAGIPTVDYDSFVGRAELAWYIAGGGDAAPAQGVGFSVLRLAYQRDADASGIGTYYQLDRVYADLSYAAGTQFWLNVRAGVAWLEMPELFSRSGADLTANGRGVKEWRPEARLYAEYRLTNTVAIFTNNTLLASPEHNYISLDPDGSNPGATRTVDDLYFWRFSLLLGARWFM